MCVSQYCNFNLLSGTWSASFMSLPLNFFKIRCIAGHKFIYVLFIFFVFHLLRIIVRKVEIRMRIVSFRCFAFILWIIVYFILYFNENKISNPIKWWSIISKNLPEKQPVRFRCLIRFAYESPLLGKRQSLAPAASLCNSRRALLEIETIDRTPSPW